MIRVLAASLVLLGTLALATEGGRTGNGFAVPCRTNEAEGIREGYYSLDYLVTTGLGPSHKIKTWEESSERIKRLLQGVLTEAQMKLYEDFVINVRNTDYSRSRVWEASPYGVLNLKLHTAVDAGDPNVLPKEQIKSNLKSLVSKLPLACQNEKGETELIPAVVFQDDFFTGRPPGNLVYKYVPKVLNELEINDALQLSYLYIHEWLWDISNNEDRNRRINQLLHSERIDGMSDGEIRKQLSGMGLTLGTPAEASPKLQDVSAVEAYRITKKPTTRLPFSEVMSKVMKQESAVQLGRYHLFAVTRSCESPSDCTPWRSVAGFWKDLTAIYGIPTEGEIFLRRESNLIILAKSNAIQYKKKGLQKMVSECAVDESDRAEASAKCRKHWVPDGEVAPIGWMFFEDMAPDLEAYFTPDGLWIGGEAKRGKAELRMALFAPYDQKRFLSQKTTSYSAPEGVPAIGEQVLPNGNVRRVVEIPGYQLPASGKISGTTPFHFEHDLDVEGTLSALKVFAQYDDAMDTIQMSAIPPDKNGKYGYGADASPTGGEPVCRGSSCLLTLRPGFARKSAQGNWQFDFTFTASPHASKVKSLKILFEVQPRV